MAVSEMGQQEGVMGVERDRMTNRFRSHATRKGAGRKGVTGRQGPVLITDVPENPETELRRREIRYVIMMLTRAVFLIAGAVLVSTKPPLWPLWLVLCVIGMVLLPWLAVILANDRPAKSRAERRRSMQRRAPAEPGELPAPPPDRVIDGDGPPVSFRDEQRVTDVTDGSGRSRDQQQGH